MKELELIAEHLKQPEYLHVLLNPIPLYGLGMGVLALTLALFWRSREARVVGLVLILVACGSAKFVVDYGHRGYDRVYAMSNPDAQQWLDLHHERGVRAAYAFYATAALTLGAVIVELKRKRIAPHLSGVVLAAAILCLGLGGWVAHAGGQVRHSEFREGPPPKTSNHQHED